MANFMLEIASVFLVLIASASTLLVTPNSPCTSKCVDDNSQTFTVKGQNISCNDVDFRGGSGRRTLECLECLQASNFGTDEKNDQASFLANLRYAVDWCIFREDNPYRISGPCLVPESCGELEASVDMGNGSFDTSGFQYCSADSGSFEGEAATCNECMQNMRGNVYLSNWLIALQAGCSQSPSQKALIGLSGSVFSTVAITITATPGAGVPFEKPNSGLPLGAIIGIAVGGAALVVAIAVGIFLRCRKRRQKQYKSSPKDKAAYWSSPLGGNVPIPGVYTGLDDRRQTIREVAWAPEDIAMPKRQNTDSTVSSDDTSPPPSVVQPPPNFSRPGTISRSSSSRTAPSQEPAVSSRVDRPRIQNPLSMHSPTPSTATNTLENTDRGSGFGVAMSTFSPPSNNSQSSPQPQIAQPTPRPALLSSPPPPRAQPPPVSQPPSAQPSPRQYSPAPQQVQQQSTPSPRPLSARLLLQPHKTQQPQQQTPRYNAAAQPYPPSQPLPTYNPATYAPQHPPSYDAATFGQAGTAHTIVLPRPNIFNQSQASRPTSQASSYQPQIRTPTNNALNIPLKSAKSSNFRPFSFVAPAAQARAKPGTSVPLTKDNIPPPPCPIIAIPNPKARKKSAILTPIDLANVITPISAGASAGGMDNPLPFRRQDIESLASSNANSARQ